MPPTQARSDNWETIRKLALFALVSVVLAAAGFFLLLLTFPSFSRTYFGTVDWNMLSAYISVISLALLAGGAAFALAEYTDKENAKRREKFVEAREKAKLSYEIYQAIFKMLTDPEQEMARRWILVHIPVRRQGEEIAGWYEEVQRKVMHSPPGSEGLPEGQKAVKLTLNCLDYIGFIAAHYWDIDEDSLDWVSPPIAKVWRRLGPYVAHIRTLRNASDYYLSAENIGQRCIEWRQKRGLPDEEFASGTL